MSISTLLDLDAEMADLSAIQAESIGWLPLGQGVYFHYGDTRSSEEPIVIEVVGIPLADMAGMNVLLLT